MGKSRRTKALEIPKAVKAAVYARDRGICIICGRHGMPNAHYISRAQGGLGVEENIVTLCAYCHGEYDQSPRRSELRERIEAYLKRQYPDWDESELYYRKGIDYEQGYPYRQSHQGP